MNNLIKKPVVSEKSSALLERNKYVFFVAPSATKTTLKHFFNQYFGVKVAAVNLMTVRTKARRVGRFFGKPQKLKKAIVTLSADSKIESVKD
ncbi:MAG: 50S ribosomal protein L23 [Candidatus Margulisiibacteriota bacterium]